MPLNRNSLAAVAGVVVMLASDYLVPRSPGQAEPAFLRLMIPCGVYAVLIGLWAGEAAWIAGSLAVGAYALVESMGRFVNPGLPVDLTYFSLVPWVALLASFGRRVACRHRDTRVLRETAGRLLSAQSRYASEDLPERISHISPAQLDDSVLSEGGLLRTVLAEDRDASVRARFGGYLLVAALLALYTATSSEFLLLAAVCVFASTVLTAVWTVLAAGPSAFDTLTTGYFELAQVRFAEAVRLRPFDVKSRIGLGLALLHLGRLDPALEELAIARQLGLHRFSIGVWIGLERMAALAAYRHGRYATAARTLHTVLSVFPHHASTHLVLALCHEGSGQMRLARELFHRAAELGSDEAVLKLGTMPDGDAPCAPQGIDRAKGSPGHV